MSNFQVKLAQTEEEKNQAYKLRYEIFLKELGDAKQTLPADGIEQDIYDKNCDHLIVIDTSKNLTIGTYRLLSGKNVNPKIGFYAEKIFQIDKIKNLGKNILEVGRSCVHKLYREKLVIELLWKGIAEYIKQNNIRYLFGSVRLYTIDPCEISEITSLIKEKYYAPEKMRVYSLKECTFKELDQSIIIKDPKKTFLKLPALAKGYLRLGMKVCGEPAWDKHLESVVFLIILDIEEMTPAYRKHFLGL